MFRFASAALIASLQSSAALARQQGNASMANFILSYAQPQRIIPAGKKRHSDGRAKKRPNRATISARVRRKHRRAA